MSNIESGTPKDDPRLFESTRGFLRASAQSDIRARLEEITAGDGPLDPREANAAAHAFLDAVADGRPVPEHYDDAVQHAEQNGLLMLFGPEQQEYFERFYTRMPDDLVERWRKALRGGDPRDSFGPLTPEERLDMRRVGEDLRRAKKLRRIQVSASALVLLAAIAGVVWWAGRSDPQTAAVGQIRFDDVEGQGDDLRAGPPPVVEPALVARLDQTVAVRLGSDPIEDRIVLDVPVTDLPAEPASVTATLMRYNGAGQVVLVGPAGWLARSCVQVSVMSATLRAFDTAYAESAPGACPADRVFGRVATVGCADEAKSTFMVDLQIPEGTVSLAEGGTAAVAAVRVALVGDNPNYERNNLSTQIAVPEGTEVKVPTFGGQVGETVSFDVSASTGVPVIGTCVLR